MPVMPVPSVEVSLTCQLSRLVTLPMGCPASGAEYQGNALGLISRHHFGRWMAIAIAVTRLDHRPSGLKQRQQSLR